MNSGDACRAAAVRAKRASAGLGVVARSSMLMRLRLGKRNKSPQPGPHELQPNTWPSSYSYSAPGENAAGGKKFRCGRFRRKSLARETEMRPVSRTMAPCPRYSSVWPSALRRMSLRKAVSYSSLNFLGSNVVGLSSPMGTRLGDAVTEAGVRVAASVSVVGGLGHERPCRARVPQGPARPLLVVAPGVAAPRMALVAVLVRIRVDVAGIAQLAAVRR